MGHQEVHGNVLAVDVFVHHVPDGLGHHVRVQVGVVLRNAQAKWREKVDVSHNNSGRRESGWNKEIEVPGQACGMKIIIKLGWVRLNFMSST